MNEETIIENGATIDARSESQPGSNAWKYVTLGGLSGILMGAGLMHAGQAMATPAADEEAGDADGQQPEAPATAPLPVAQLHNDLSFGAAFAAARAEVGPGGVFIWHGGIYNTYTAEEWSAMTAEQKNDFARQVNPEVRAHDVPTPTDAHPDVAVHPAHDAAPQAAGDADVQVVDQQTLQNFDMGDDVHIVGFADAEGHLVVGYDTTGDGHADVAVIDIDDNQELSAPDIVVDREGRYATLGDLAAHAATMEAADELPGTADEPQPEPDFPVIDI